MTTVAVLTLVKILKNHTCACVLIICTWKPTTKLAQASTTVLVAHVNNNASTPQMDTSVNAVPDLSLTPMDQLALHAQLL